MEIILMSPAGNLHWLNRLEIASIVCDNRYTCISHRNSFKEKNTNEYINNGKEKKPIRRNSRILCVYSLIWSIAVNIFAKVAVRMSVEQLRRIE
jgi:hypothetical protein